ncbi:hypothetical protein SIL82_10505 [Sphingomonas echinoides]|uniref:Uncharacterized protein n=2 Tax=Sphingomonas echinoides TaxID=59803 RepID=A0ABU4PL55_9SPHN|nr:hypothetical protein [Sphingomonas echinoides]MDX5984694.1 hypothetical protein [Sphingomonas echinoides]
MVEAIQGLNQAIATIEVLPNAARWEFADMLGRLGRDILAIQRAHVARDTGALAAGLSSELHVDDALMRLKVGLLGVEARSRSAKRRAAKAGGGDPRNLGDIFYGRFIEFGRKAQTVVVERRRRVAGQLRTEPNSRGRRKRIEDIAGTYKMNVRAMAPRPFINPPDGSVDAVVDQRTTSFWERTLSRAGAV